MNVEKYLSLVRRAEFLLSEAFLLVADRHGKNPEILQGSILLSSWSSRHALAIDAHLPGIDRKTASEPDRIRSALFHDPRVGSLGLLRDLHDLAVLAQYVHMCWTILLQAAHARKDAILIELCQRANAETTRQIAWIRTHIKVAAPQTLTVPAPAAAQGMATIPSRPGASSLPDMIWAPAAAAVLLLFVGSLALLAGQPWLVPSLGPSAYLVAADAAHPSARVYNVVVGHAVGLAAGLGGVAVLGAWADPVLLSTGQLTLGRMLAAALALAVTVLGCLLLRANHPPAGATTLLVALGSIATKAEFLSVAIGVVLLAAAGYVLRGWRMGVLRRKLVHRAPPRLMAPGAAQPRLSNY